MNKNFLVYLAIFFGILFTSIPASAAECSAYEQSHPAYMLDGSHLSTGKCSTCATCHRQGVFMGTPRTCIACHNGDPARVTVGRPTNHVPTLLTECSSCHNTTTFTAYNMNHAIMSSVRCDSCHNQTYKNFARAKDSEHIPTTLDCVQCHNTHNWDVSHAQIHAGVTTGCVSCHNGTTATGKINYALGHPITSDNCEQCHSIDAAFKCAEAIQTTKYYFAAFMSKIKAILA